MSDQYRELMQDAVRELRKARERVDELERRERTRHAPASIVGFGCNLPGDIEDPESLWQFLRDGRCAKAPVPKDRFASLGLPDVIPDGAWLANPFGFDAQFFRMAPREARVVDPQQRLLLEVAHQAIEHAGLAPDQLAGKDVGVFVGISTQDWTHHLTQHLPAEEIDGASGPGTNPCAAAGRISFALGLTGPSFAINTACSSSLVALHTAMQALRNGECEMALVLGVNAMLSPLTSVTFQRAGMLAPDGRCKTFAADADGYARGEGAVGVLLATQAVVKERNLRVHADVLGSAVNQDGATAGLTVPSGPAQQRVVKCALEDAGITPDQVQFIEAHGTGTLLGDPIELQALAGVFAADRSADKPLYVASAKTNFGHLEAAAGLLSIVKAALQLEHQRLVPHLHFTLPNPHINWSELPFRVPTNDRDYPACERAIGGISSFSFTGTNAHVVLARNTPMTNGSDQAGPFVLPISARTEAALRAQCGRWADYLAKHPDVGLADVAATAALGRSTMRVRAAIQVQDVAQAERLLRQLADGSLTPTDAANDDITRGFVAGQTTDWHAQFPVPFHRVPLPTYAFQRQTFNVPFAVAAITSATGSATSNESPATHAELRQAIDAAPAAARVSLLTKHVQQVCAMILRLRTHELSCDEALLAYGFDSMRAVELANTLEQQLGQAMPLSDLLDGATIHNVATAIANRWQATDADEDALLRRIAAMSDDEVESRLRESSGEQ